MDYKNLDLDEHTKIIRNNEDGSTTIITHTGVQKYPQKTRGRPKKFKNPAERQRNYREQVKKQNENESEQNKILRKALTNISKSVVNQDNLALMRVEILDVLRRINFLGKLT